MIRYSVTLFALFAGGIAFADDKEQADQAYNKGTILMNQGKNKEAIPFFDKAIELNPRYLAAWQNRGLSYANMGEYAKALKNADEALKLKPEFAYAYQLKAFVYNRQAKYAESTNAATEAIRLYPEYAAAYNIRGGNYYAVKDYRKALENYEKALEFNPKLSNIHYQMGCCKWDMRHDDLAEILKHFDKAVEQNPEFFGAYEMRAKIYTLLGKDDEAKKDCERCLKLNPGNKDHLEKSMAEAKEIVAAKKKK